MSGRRLHFRRDHRKSLAGFSRPCRFGGGNQREQVGLARDCLNESYNLADAGAAFRSPIIVLTVGCVSETARPATSVDFAACETISPMDAASSSTELAATATCGGNAAFGVLEGGRVGGLVEACQTHFQVHRCGAKRAQRTFDESGGIDVVQRFRAEFHIPQLQGIGFLATLLLCGARVVSI